MIFLAIKTVGENEFRLFSNKERTQGYYEVKDAFNRIIKKSEILSYKDACKGYDSTVKEYEFAHGLKLT